MPTHQPDDASIVSDNNDDEVFRPKKKELDPRFVLSGLIMFILVSSSGLALVAQNRDTDNRSSASEGELADQAPSEPCIETEGNVITNPSFENDFKGWSRAKNIGVSIIKPAGAPHCRKVAKFTILKEGPNINADTTTISKPVNIKPATHYKVTFWARSNASMLDESDFYSQLVIQVKEDTPVLTGSWPRLHFPSGDYFFPDKNWKKFEATAVSSPEFSSLNSRLYVVIEATKGKPVFIDNIVLTEIPAPTPTLQPTPTEALLPTPTATQSAQKRVFITSSMYNGNLGGVLGADDKCEKSALEASLGGIWKAWISTTNPDTFPINRFTHAQVPYINLNGTKVADNWDDLVDGNIDAPIYINEFGAENSDENGSYDIPAANVWTHTRAEGNWGAQYEVNYACMDWTDNNEGNYGVIGYSSLQDTQRNRTSAWSMAYYPLWHCNREARIYCFEQ